MLQFRASKSGPVWCVRLPAAVTFPTDAKLLERIEKSRKTLPLNSVKPLRCAAPLGHDAAGIRPTERPRAPHVRAA
jgi:hypothetical protein